MQVLRYIAAILLGLVLSLSLFVSLANLGLNRTVLKPEFIPEQLVNADVYRFVMIDLLPSAIDDTRMVNPRDYGLRLRANTIDASGLSTQEITDSILRAVSPEDFERTVSPVALGIGEYVTWNEDRVDLSTDVGTHIKAAVAELRVLMRESGAYGRLLEWEIEPRIREITGEALAAIAHPKGWSVFLFKGSPETDDRMADAVLLAFTPDWLTGEVEEALDVLPGYFVGDSEVFEFNVRPDDREVDASLEEIKALILETDSSDLLYTGVVERPVTDSFREPAQLPLGAKLSADDVLSAMRQAAPPSWVNEQAETVVDGVSAYVVGRLDEFSIEVSLVDNRSRAADILTELAMANVGDALVNLPLCDAETDEALDLLSPGVSLPDCMVPGISVNEVLTSVKPGIADAARTLLLDHVPDSVVFTEEALRSDLMSAGGREFIASFDRLRSFYSDGWTYNQDELRDDLSNEPDILQLLDGARSYLSEGYIHTYEEEQAQNDDNLAANSLDNVREWVQSVRRYQLPAYIATVVLLAAFAIVLGRSWSGRIGWASFAILGASIVVFLLAGPVYRSVANAAFEEVRDEARSQAAGHFSETGYLAFSKLVDLVEGSVNDVPASISQLGLVFAIAALIAMASVIIWQRYCLERVTQARPHGSAPGVRGR